MASLIFQYGTWSFSQDLKISAFHTFNSRSFTVWTYFTSVVWYFLFESVCERTLPLKVTSTTVRCWNVVSDYKTPVERSLSVRIDIWTFTRLNVSLRDVSPTEDTSEREPFSVVCIIQDTHSRTFVYLKTKSCGTYMKRKDRNLKGCRVGGTYVDTK